MDETDQSAELPDAATDARSTDVPAPAKCALTAERPDLRQAWFRANASQLALHAQNLGFRPGELAQAMISHAAGMLLSGGATPDQVVATCRRIVDVIALLAPEVKGDAPEDHHPGVWYSTLKF